MERLSLLTMASENICDPPSYVKNVDVDTSPKNNHQPSMESSHSGLSALLSAVTLHISKAEDESTIEDCNHRQSNIDTQIAHHDNLETGLRSTMTPTMIPEDASHQRQIFPSILMSILLESRNNDIITFLPDGKYFALRQDDFSSQLMKDHFQCEDYEIFERELFSWGFSRVETKRPGIHVYRNPMFLQDHCDPFSGQKKQEESGAEYVDVSCKSDLTSRTSSISEDDIHHKGENPLLEGNKRRLSPTSSFTANNGSISKFCKSNNNSEESSIINGTPTLEPYQPNELLIIKDYRTTAIAITTEKLNIREEDDDQELPLIQQAVVGATHTIVTDAIECLLRDELHTKFTFQKHAEELSKSVLPGLIPISKQLFSAAIPKDAETESCSQEQKHDLRLDAS
jgi:HSF-type DNA-binding